MPGPRRRLREQQMVEETPGIEAWDSVSQAPSTPQLHQRSLPARLGEYDAMSAETATATEGPVGFQSQEDRDIAQHLLRNRRGWYDHRHGRFLG